MPWKSKPLTAIELKRIGRIYKQMQMSLKKLNYSEGWEEMADASSLVEKVIRKVK